MGRALPTGALLLFATAAAGSPPLDTPRLRLVVLPSSAAMVSPPPAATPTSTPLWRRWQVWAVGGAVVAIAAGLLIAERTGSDELTIQVRR